MKIPKTPSPEALRKVREAFGWSREDAAGQLGISAKTVESYEIGRRQIPPWIWKLITCLGGIRDSRRTGS